MLLVTTRNALISPPGEAVGSSSASMTFAEAGVTIRCLFRHAPDPEWFGEQWSPETVQVSEAAT
jgi:hypothetical protein